MPKLVGVSDGDPGDSDTKEKRDKIREVRGVCVCVFACFKLASTFYLLMFATPVDVFSLCSALVGDDRKWFCFVCF